MVAIKIVEFENLGDQLVEDPFAIWMRETFEKAGINGNPLTEDDISSDLLAVIEELSVKRGKEIQILANKYVRYSILSKKIFRGCPFDERFRHSE